MQRKSKIKNNNINSTYSNIDVTQSKWSFSNEQTTPDTLPGLNKVVTNESNQVFTNEQADIILQRIHNKYVHNTPQPKLSDKEQYFNKLQQLFTTLSDKKDNPLTVIKNYLILTLLIIFPSNKLASMLVNHK